MGKTKCPKHGYSGIANVCPHIRSSVIENTLLGDFVCWKQIICDYEWPHWFCTNCYNKLQQAGLPNSGDISQGNEDDEFIERVFGQIKGLAESAVCNKCLNESIEKRIV